MFGCAPTQFQNITTSNVFEPLDWYQFMPYLMIERFNTSGILGAKFCGTNLCNLPDPSMDTDLRGTGSTSELPITTSPSTFVAWNGFTWPATEGPLIIHSWKRSDLRFKIESGRDQVVDEGQQDQNYNIKNCPDLCLLILCFFRVLFCIYQ